MSWQSAVNDFWFAELRPEDWFGGGKSLDDKIRARFSGLYEELRNTPPSPAALDAFEHLAAVIAFDQFPRNMFRGTAAAFGTDTLALTMAKDAADRGLDKALEQLHKQFLYMPFMHSENRADQARSLELFTALGHAEALDFAHQHKDVIDRFGRFPSRNASLGRASTPEEKHFLTTTPYRW
jgi:uncharacterized protein (DUF924 family)